MPPAGCHYGVGFALSGGFIKGFAHLGMMQALFEHGIRPEIIAGVSAGALAGAFIADGQEPYRVVEIFRREKFNSLTSFAGSVSGLLKLDEFRSRQIRAVPLGGLEPLCPGFVLYADIVLACCYRRSALCRWRRVYEPAGHTHP